MATPYIDHYSEPSQLGWSHEYQEVVEDDEQTRWADDDGNNLTEGE